MARSGLKKVVKTVKGKKRSVKRTYWVKAQGAAGKAGGAVRGFAQRHSGKLKVVAGLAALAGVAYGAHRASSVAHGVRSGIGAYKEASQMRSGAGQPPVSRREKLSGVMAAIGHGASEARQHEGSLAGRNIAGLAHFATSRAKDHASLAGLRISRAASPVTSRLSAGVSRVTAPISARLDRAAHNRLKSAGTSRRMVAAGY
jgi:hypothetical protein